MSIHTCHHPTFFLLSDLNGTFTVTDDANKHHPDIPHAAAHRLLSNFRQYSWGAGSEFQKLMRQLWKYIQSFEDEHYQIYYKRNVNEETLQDYSSAIQEIIPRLTKIQSVLNHNARGFPDMMRWTPPNGLPMDMKSAMKEGAQDCEEFAIFARQAANGANTVSEKTAGAIIQGALACQAAASKAATALQRGKFGDPACDPATVIASNSMNSVTALVTCNRKQSFKNFL